MTIVMPNKFLMLAATLILALGVTSTVNINNAQAGHRDGRIIAGAIAGAALFAIIASQHRKKRRRYRRHRKNHYYHGGYDRPAHVCYNRYGEPYRCYKRNRRHHRHYDRW